jgi:hypothetical protein
VTTPSLFIEAPAGIPLPFGLGSVAVVDDRPAGDVHWQQGIQYQPLYCGPAYTSDGVCAPAPDYGTASVAVSTTRVATLTLTGAPGSGDSFHIDWGDGNHTDDTTPSGDTHTYAADGSYTVVVTDDGVGAGVGYIAILPITVTNGSTSSSGSVTAEQRYVPVDGISTVEGVPFTVYHWLRCRPVGESDLAARARAGLLAGEWRAAEKVLAHQLATDTDAVDLTPTPGTAVHPIDGLGIAADWAGENYGAAPTYHATPRTATVLGSLAGVSSLASQGRQLRTVLGSPVAAGGGYVGMNGPGDTAAGDGEAWLYVTGTVLARRGQDVEVRPPMSTSPASNTLDVLALRPYVLSTECIIGAVLVTSPYGVPV